MCLPGLDNDKYIDHDHVLSDHDKQHDNYQFVSVSDANILRMGGWPMHIYRLQSRQARRSEMHHNHEHNDHKPR